MCRSAAHELYGPVAKLRPVHLDEESFDRLRTYYPKGTFTESNQTLLLPVPEDDDLDLVAWLRGSVELILTLRDTVPADA